MTTPSFDLKDNWAPRIGVVWDCRRRNGRSKIYGNWGRFYESIPLDINIRSFGGEAICFCYNFDPNSARHSAGSAAPAPQSLLGGATPADPNLRVSTSTSACIGVEYEVGHNLALGAKYVHRNLGRVIEDFLVPSEGELLHRQPRPGPRPGDGVLRLRHARRRRRRPTRDNYSVRAQRAQALHEQLAVPGELRLDRSSKATTTARSRSRPASSIRTSTRRSTTPTSW